MKRLLYLIPAGDRAAANTYAKAALDPVAGEYSFRFGVSPTGQLPATHYLASGLVPTEKDAAIAIMKTAFATAKLLDWDLEKEINRPAELLESLGLKRIEDPNKP